MESIEGEVWRPVTDWEDLYEVSNMGRILRLDRCGPGGCRAGIAKTTLGKTGKYGKLYQRMSMYRRGQHPGKSVLVHLLVAQEFLGPRPEGHVVQFKNGDSTDCRASNLYYRTWSQPRFLLQSDIGSEVTCPSAHRRVWMLWGKASQYPCVDCGGPANQWAYDETDPTYLMNREPGRAPNRYSRYPEFYMPMCRSCHGKRDGAARSVELSIVRDLMYELGLNVDEMVEFVREICHVSDKAMKESEAS